MLGTRLGCYDGASMENISSVTLLLQKRFEERMGLNGTVEDRSTPQPVTGQLAAQSVALTSDHAEAQPQQCADQDRPAKGLGPEARQNHVEEVRKLTEEALECVFDADPNRMPILMEQQVANIRRQVDLLKGTAIQPLEQ
uniref:Uncharacterized protein n=1 Tax=Ulva partita TaxID=1605170 RepID=A0A1C9ZQL5_9CHLO|nr:hypothetical protein [Ulva partita]